MSLSPQDLQKQSVIYHSLKKHLTHTQLLEAMYIWQSKYATEPGVAVRYFADDIARISDNKVKPKTLVMSMVSSLTSPTKNLPDPSEEIAKYCAAKSNTIINPVGQEVAALCALISKLFSFTPEPELTAIKRAFKQSIASIKKPTVYEQNLILWLNDDTHKILGANTIKPLRNTLNALYTVYCEHLGPIQTDVLLANSLKRLESNGGAIYKDIYKKLL